MSPTTPPVVRSSSTIRCRTAPAEPGPEAPPYPPVSHARHILAESVPALSSVVLYVARHVNSRLLGCRTSVVRSQRLGKHLGLLPGSSRLGTSAPTTPV